jgi:tRNA A37 threonylcarbamoyladenosine synthetase subunit TsaC/SUA5/YrdC
LPPALTVEQAAIYFNETLDYIVNNYCGNSLPSTIVDLSNSEVKILRVGAIKQEDIYKILGE